MHYFLLLLLLVFLSPSHNLFDVLFCFSCVKALLYLPNVYFIA